MRLIPAMVSLSCSLVVCSVAAAATADTPIDKIYTYEDNEGAWNTWAYLKDQANNPLFQINSQSVIADTTIGDANNHSYQLDVTLNSSDDATKNSYVYFQLPYQVALFGSLGMSTDIKVAVISGDASKADVSLGMNLYDYAFGISGHVLRPLVMTADGQWHTVSSDIMQSATQNILSSSSAFAESQVTDFLPYSKGPVLYLINRAKPSDNSPPFHVRITIDNLSLSGTVASMTGYKEEGLVAAQNYVSRITPTLTSVDQSITSTKTSIDNLPLGNQQVLFNQIKSEASDIITDHNDIVSSYSSRSVPNAQATLHVPTQAQYDQDIKNQTQISNLLNTGNNVVSTGLNFLFYPWEATGQALLNEQTVGISSDAPQQPIQATAALNEKEPIAAVLQNLFADEITVNQIDATNLVNQFGETLPPSQLDVRVVKSWFMGSSTSINVRSTDVKTLIPELLLKDDAMLQVDETTKTNLLRINSQGTQSYADVSTPTALLPNDAVAEDANSLQPFVIKPMRAKQIWLTLDTRAQVHPGNYSGSINVSYRLGTDTAVRTLQIPVSLFVAPISLENSPLTYAIYYRGVMSSNGITYMNSENKSQQQFMAEMKNMADHGVLYPTQYLTGSTTPTATDLSSMLAVLQSEIQLREQVGLPCDKYYLLNGIANIGVNPTTAYNNAVQLQNTLANTSNCAAPQLYMYGKDEAKGIDLDNEKTAITKIHEVGAKSYVAGYTGTYNHIGDVLDTLVFSGTPDDAEIGQWRADGSDVFSYGNPQVGVPNPWIYRSNYGLLLWQHNYTGAMDYAYQDGERPSSSRLCTPTSTAYCSIWNNFDSSTYYDHMFAYPTTSGVIDTIQWEGFREAVDDTRYLATLQSLVNSSTNTALAIEINDWLVSIKTQSDLDPIATRRTMQNYFQRLNQAPTLSNVSVTLSGSTATATGQASDPEGYLGLIEAKLDSGNWQPAALSDNSWQIAFANVTTGAHTVHYRVTDYWGAVTTQQSTIEVSTHGLTGNYYNSNNFSGTPIVRIDTNIEYDWGNGSPVSGIGTNNFSVRWTGKVVPSTSGNFKFCAIADDSAEILVNGNPVLTKQWNQDSNNPVCSGTVALTKDQPATLQINYIEYYFTARAKLLWILPGQSTPVVIPSTQLLAQ